MSSIQSPNSFWLVGFLYRSLGNRVWPVRGVPSRFNTLKSKRYYGKNNLKVRRSHCRLITIACTYSVRQKIN